MIAVDMGGRLGNQLFIYAFAVSAAARLDCRFIVDFDFVNPHAFELPRFFESPRFDGPWNRRRLSAYRAVRRMVPRVEIDSVTAPSVYTGKLRRFARYVGWMQSEEFFAPHQALVRQELTLRESVRRTFADRYASRLCRMPTIVIHYRRTDYRKVGNPSLGLDMRLPHAYYDVCLARIPDLNKHQVFVVGDDLTAARAHYRGRDNFFFEENEPIVDFQLLLAADTAIISNSSFAWWAAWLNPSRRPVFGPKHWLGFKAGSEWPAGITSQPWTWVDVPRYYVPEDHL